MHLCEREALLVETVDGLSDDIVDFTGRLVAEPSTLGNESTALLVTEDEWIKLGFNTLHVPIDPEKASHHPGFARVPWSCEGRYSLVAKTGPEGTGARGAIFNGHLDVVSPEPLGFWDEDPFRPVVKNGWLYGRGSADMKAGPGRRDCCRIPAARPAVRRPECPGDKLPARQALCHVFPRDY